MMCSIPQVKVTSFTIYKLEALIASILPLQAISRFCRHIKCLHTLKSKVQQTSHYNYIKQQSQTQLRNLKNYYKVKLVMLNLTVKQIWSQFQLMPCNYKASKSIAI